MATVAAAARPDAARNSAARRPRDRQNRFCRTPGASAAVRCAAHGWSCLRPMWLLRMVCAIQPSGLSARTTRDFGTGRQRNRQRRRRRRRQESGKNRQGALQRNQDRPDPGAGGFHEYFYSPARQTGDRVISSRSAQRDGRQCIAENARRAGAGYRVFAGYQQYRTLITDHLVALPNTAPIFP